jgi:hypothetical protein
MMTATLTTDHGHVLHRPSSSGLAFWGPGDSYRFLITGAESGGAYFAMEAIVPAGGGPPPHIHRNEDETFFFEETLERAKDPEQAPPDNLDEVAARYAEAAPRYGMEFLVA